jgi:hypothetical protein
MFPAKNIPTPNGLLTEFGAIPGIVEFKPETEEARPIYRALADHQVSEEWDFGPFVAELHRWALIFDAAFELRVPEVSLAIDRLRRTRMGQFREGHNQFGLKGEIILNDLYLIGVLEPFEVLGTLLHEMLHGWQQAYGKPGKHNYHNKQFREKAREYGLIIDDRGRTEYDPDGRFFSLLRQHGMELPDLPTPSRAVRRRGDSKLKRWSCGCTNVRVAVPNFHARCLRCGQDFFRCD